MEGAGKIKFVLMKEHPVMGYALSFMAGAFAALAFRIPAIYFFIIAAIAAVFIVFLIYRKKRPWVFMIIVFLSAGYFLCQWSIPDWYFEGYVPPEECRIAGTVESVESTGYSYEYVLTDVQIEGEDIDSKIEINNITDNDYISEGYRIELYAVLERPAAALKSGMFAKNRYYMTKNIQYTAVIFDSWINITATDAGKVSVSSSLKQKISDRLSEDFKQPVSGLIYSLITGDKSQMDKEIYADCADLGIAHIFAISGLHIGALLVLWEYFCKKAKKRFLIKILGSAVLVGLLYAVVGARASLLRAIFMWALYVVYQYIGVKGNLIDFLAIAMLGLLAFNPLYVIDLGFLLSVTCVGAIGLVYAPFAGMKKSAKFTKAINFYPVSMFIVSVSILSISWVLTAKAFGQVALLSPVWNVVFVPMAILLISLLLGYGLLFYVPLLGGVLSWIIDKYVSLIIYLVKIFSSVNINIAFSKMGFIPALAIMAILLLMTDLILKGRKKMRIIAGIAAAALILSGVYLIPEKDRMEVYAGYEASFIYIHENSQDVLIINEDDGGIERVISDIGCKEIDVFIYSGNDIEDIEELVEGAQELSFAKIIIHEDLLLNYSGNAEYISVKSYENIKLGNVDISLTPFRANENAVTHYYADITYYGKEFTYLDPLRLREGAIGQGGIAVSSRWTKQRIENIAYASPECVIINSKDYLMGEKVTGADGHSISVFNINNSGAFTQYP